MVIVAIVGAVFGTCGVLFGLACYRELHKWARQCQNARIAVAHKRRVQLNAPLTEWLQWANALNRDESSTGRVIYRNGHVTVAILRPKSPSRIRTTLADVRNARRRKRVPTGPAPAQATPRHTNAG